MPSIDQYVTDDRIRLLIQGKPGSGKTTLAMQFPKVWIMDCDVNLGGPLRHIRDNNIPTSIVGYDSIDTTDGKEVALPFRYERLLVQSQKAYSDPAIETVVFDSATKISDYITAHILRTQPTKTGNMEIPSWGFFFAYWKNLIAGVTAARKHTVVIFHEKAEKDEVDGSWKYGPMVSGQFGQIVQSLFTDVWRTEIEGKVVWGQPATQKFVVRTTPDAKFDLKNSLHLPPMFEFAWNEIQKRIEGSK